MIIQKESILTSGIPYKFKTAPIDPNDPFRGKYITLGFDANEARMPDETMWQSGDVVYVTLGRDSLGYASIKSISRQVPADEGDYIRASVGFFFGAANDSMTIDYPMSRFYMEESKAYEAEMVYLESQVDTNQVAYAIVRVKAGDAVVEDVLIDGISVRELVARETKY